MGLQVSGCHGFGFGGACVSVLEKGATGGVIDRVP